MGPVRVEAPHRRGEIGELTQPDEPEVGAPQEGDRGCRLLQGGDDLQHSKYGRSKFGRSKFGHSK